MDGDVQDDEVRLAVLFDAHYRTVLAYALRRADSETAEEVAADVFTVAWRRLEDVPPGPAALPWLLVVARNTLSNHHRGQRRRSAAESRHEADRTTVHASASPSTENAVTDRLVLLRALAELSDQDRELLTLIAWEELTPTEAATVLGIRPALVRVRLSRARSRLRAALASSPVPTAALSTVEEPS